MTHHLDQLRRKQRASPPLLLRQVPQLKALLRQPALELSWKGIQSHSPVVFDGQPLARPPRLLGGGAPVVSLPGHELQAASHRLHGEAFNEHSPNEKAEVEFVNAVTAGGSVKFLPTV